ncbi:UV DNA damage repair endonuclease UvsE [Candidatus Saccharibacteria bacterium]|nr:UV DNA damage repair endonuclease UvsE [Candidatus Saccharibacteria bacterium]
MKIGYPVTNLGLGHKSTHTFRLASFSEELFTKVVNQNLESLRQTLEWNAAHGLLFYRISSGLIPFASHANMTINWQQKFKEEFKQIGEFIRNNNFRISLHPGQYVVLNSPSQSVYLNSVRELEYHADILDLLGLDSTHKFQFHMGGVHGDKTASLNLFVERYKALPEKVRRRLVIENDERVACLDDCLQINRACGIPVLFDTLHHQIYNTGETLLKGLTLAMATWDIKRDGTPMIDFSTQNDAKKSGAHALTLDVDKFRSFAKSLKHRDIDIMLEIKNKEASALQAQIVLSSLA